MSIVNSYTFIDLDGELINVSAIQGVGLRFSSDELLLEVSFIWSDPEDYCLFSVDDLTRWELLSTTDRLKFRREFAVEAFDFLKARFPCYNLGKLLMDLANDRLNTYPPRPSQTSLHEQKPE